MIIDNGIPPQFTVCNKEFDNRSKYDGMSIMDTSYIGTDTKFIADINTKKVYKITHHDYFVNKETSIYGINSTHNRVRSVIKTHKPLPHDGTYIILDESEVDEIYPYDPPKKEPEPSIYSRYANKEVDEKYYGTINSKPPTFNFDKEYIM